MFSVGPICSSSETFGKVRITGHFFESKQNGVLPLHAPPFSFVLLVVVARVRLPGSPAKGRIVRPPTSTACS